MKKWVAACLLGLCLLAVAQTAAFAFNPPVKSLCIGTPLDPCKD